MAYVDGFIIPVPAGKKDARRDMAKTAAEVFIEHGALRLAVARGARHGEPRIMSDPHLQSASMPFDMKRMIFGGFEVMLDTGEKV